MSTSTSSSEASLPRRFPLAAQPEIMRAAEKDDQYASFVYDACRDAFRHLFGSFLYYMFPSIPSTPCNFTLSSFNSLVQVQGLLQLIRGRLDFQLSNLFHFKIHKFSKTIFTTKKMIFVVMHCGQHIGCYIVFPVFLILQTKLMGQMLYYVLTTGSGQQTLGEEYCDITQVSTHYLPS